MRILMIFLILSFLLSGCISSASTERSTATIAVPTFTSIASPTTTAIPIPSPSATSAPTATAPANTPTSTPTSAPTVTIPAVTATATFATASTASAAIAQTGASGVPAFDHILLIVFENHDYAEVIGNKDLPNFNQLAQHNVLLTQYHAVAHPSLPNYLALTGGSTFGITSDCFNCFLDQPSLADRIEAGGRTWKTYQEGMSKPCALGLQQGGYDQNHDPFVYFNPIRLDAARCAQSVVPMTQLNADLSAGQLPNFALIMPDLCHSAHSCPLTNADQWLGQTISQLQNAPALGQNSLIFITFDESSSDHSSCCGMPARAGGRVPAIIISPLAKNGFQDDTPLSHYSLLKTILQSWNLPGLGETENPDTLPITAPWK